jgi:hypothetical protein
MTTEEIERILQTVAENQAKHDEEFAMLLKSQNRYDERLATISDIMHDLADKQLKNEESRLETNRRFAELAAAQVRYEARQEQLEASYQLFEEFVREFRNETNQRLDGQDKANVHIESWFDTLIDAQIQLTHRVDTLTGDIAALNGRVDRIGQHLDQVAALQTANAEQIKALIATQARTDEQIRSLIERNGSTATPKAKVKKAKKAVKKVRKRGD